MKAIVVNEWIAPCELSVSEIPDPSAATGMVVIDVKAAGCNFFDILLVQGKYQTRPPFPFTPGAELAGIVESIGEDVDNVAVGDKVFASTNFGSYAEKIAVPAAVVHKLSPSMTFQDAAALPIVYPTAYAALVNRARIQPGETVLITAAAGGVGIAAIQIAKALGARVIALAGGDDKLAVTEEAGADVCIDYRKDDWIDQVRKAAPGGTNVVIENVGGDIFHGTTKNIAWDGRIVVVGFAGGSIPEIKANRILLKNIAIIGLHWGPHVVQEPETVMTVMNALNELYEAGKIKPRIFKTFGLKQVPEALSSLASRLTYGKLIIEP